MGFVGSERFLDGLVQGSSGASGRANDTEIYVLKTTPVRTVREKRWTTTATVLGRKVDALPRWHCQDGRRVGCTVDGLEADSDRSAEPWALGQ